MNYIDLPLFDATDGTVSVNKLNILDIRPVEVHLKDGPTQWAVRLTMLSGNSYILKTTDAPYDTKAEAVTAKDAFIAAL